jgi:hypothetical protein
MNILVHVVVGVGIGVIVSIIFGLASLAWEFISRRFKR